MNFFKNLLGKKDQPINSYTDFWNWFLENEKQFHRAIKSREDLETKFFQKLSPKLHQICSELYFQTGMRDNNTVELIITPEGIIKNIVFAEELVAAAPVIPNWKFTALKPAIDIEDISIQMDGYEFRKDNIFFYPNLLEEYPDEIDITIIHTDFNQEHKSTIINGTYIFLDHFIGELDLVTSIDNMSFEAQSEGNELIPVVKLKDYLKWRQTEFIEKYDGFRYDTENDNYASFEAELENGNPYIAIINTDLLKWNSKASHPWVLIIELKYDGSANDGFPSSEDYDKLDELENELIEELPASDGYLNIGRQTADSVREIYYACKEFKKPSKVVPQILNSYAPFFEGSFDLYKDKYWKSYNRFNQP
jgi:hypothetical protein